MFGDAMQIVLVLLTIALGQFSLYVTEGCTLVNFLHASCLQTALVTEYLLFIFTTKQRLTVIRQSSYE